jgi:hypothetical protein
MRSCQTTARYFVSLNKIFNILYHICYDSSTFLLNLKSIDISILDCFIPDGLNPAGVVETMKLKSQERITETGIQIENKFRYDVLCFFRKSYSHCCYIIYFRIIFLYPIICIFVYNSYNDNGLC